VSDRAAEHLELLLRARSFTFAELHARTAELDGPQRLDVFGHLPAILQQQCWADLRERFDHVAALDHRDYCDGL